MLYLVIMVKIWHKRNISLLFWFRRNSKRWLLLVFGTECNDWTNIFWSQDFHRR